MNAYHIVCSTDDNYAPYCGTMLYSLLDNNKNSVFHIHILIEQLGEENKKKLGEIAKTFNSILEFHHIDSKKLDKVKFRKKKPLSKAAYYRILLPSTLDESIHKVLYLDCDIIVLNNIDYLFKLDIQNYALAAVKDLNTQPCCLEHYNQLSFDYNDDYFNSGLMVINLKYWRDNLCEPKLISFAEQDRTVFFHDQDALNYLFKKVWYRLSPQTCFFNLCLYEQIDFNNREDFLEYINQIYIIHYAATEKPWHKLFFYPNKSYFVKYYKQTPWKDKALLTHPCIIKAYRRILFIKIKNVAYHSPILFRAFIDALFFIVNVCCLGRLNYPKWRF